MDSRLFIALLTPALTLIFALAFVVLWTYQRRRHYILGLAFAYTACALGFLLQNFPQPLGELASSIASNLLLTAAMLSLAIAAVTRYGRRVPLVALGLLGFGGMAVWGWFRIVQPDQMERIFALNSAFGAISLLIAAELRAVKNKGGADKVLMILALMAAADFYIRPLGAFWIDGSYRDQDDFYLSSYWIMTNFSTALFSVLIALSLVGAVAFDVLRELQVESRTDPLSGLLNRRGFHEKSAACLNQATGYRLPVALVLADLDHFKVVNDTYGHAAGDRVIAAFAAHLRTAGGPKAIVGRIGGEEFAAILPASDLVAARLFAEGVRAALSQEAIAGLPAHATQITASFGVAARHGNEDLGSLMRRADDALYQAKNNGRDSVRLAGHSEELLSLALKPLRSG